MSTEELKKEISRLEKERDAINKKLRELETEYKTAFRNERISTLESYKFDYDNVKYEDCNIEQLMYLVYIKYGPDKKWQNGRFGQLSVYNRDYCYGDVSCHTMNDNEYKSFLISHLNAKM